MPELFIGSDHRGYEKKNRLVEALVSGAIDDAGFTVSDLGPFSYNPDDDYNDIAIAVAKAVQENKDSRGILLCGSANGVAIQANRFKGIRAIAPTIADIARLGREHNDANILCLSADFLDNNNIDSLSSIFLNTQFSGEERHQRRIKKLDQEEI